MITSSNFRDNHLSALLIGYDWERSEHFAGLTLQEADGHLQTYSIERLTAWAVFEDFSAQHIEQCTLLTRPGEVYLSLDPHKEGNRSEQDNFWFVGARIIAMH
ncbi:MAG: hypothetical protein QM719_00345 [Thermomonas sp.]